MSGAEKPRLAPRSIPGAVWTLGFVSLLMDSSSEMIHALLPVYLVTAMGASFAEVGWIEGVAEATASITKLFSGAMSDWIGRRKLLAVTGYGLAALAKPIFPLARSLDWIVVARFVDRVGKGIRGAPRDALLAASAPAELRGASFGLRQTLDTVGAFVGPLAAMALMWLTAENFRFVFWAAAAPAMLSVGLLALNVQEPESPPPPARFPLHVAEIRRLGPVFWSVVGLSGVFTMARFSEAFLILRAEQAGLPIVLAPAVLIVMNVVYAAAAYPAGVLSDRFNRIAPLALGFFVLVVADLVLGLSSGLWLIALGVALWGLHMGFTQGLLATLVADAAPAERRGSAFGLFNLVNGVVLLIASALAGWLWDRFGSPATFLAGALFATAALALLFIGHRRGKWPPSTNPEAL
jgi:MFS family permease